MGRTWKHLEECSQDRITFLFFFFQFVSFFFFLVYLLFFFFFFLIFYLNFLFFFFFFFFIFFFFFFFFFVPLFFEFFLFLGNPGLTLMSRSFLSQIMNYVFYRCRYGTFSYLFIFRNCRQISLLISGKFERIN